MKYCVSYNQPKEVREKADEWVVELHQSETCFADFSKDNREKRYIFDISKVPYPIEEKEKLFKNISNVNPNYTFACENTKLLKELLEKGYNAFWKYPVQDWETFTNLVNLGVSDILIGGVLGFCQKELLLSKGKVRLRTIPHIASINSISTDICSFFIRPEDVSEYEGCIDTLDFSFNTDANTVNAQILEIYKRQYWDGELNSIIIGSNEDINNQLINLNNQFVKNRLNCHQKCKIPGNSCHICPNQIVYAKLVKRAIMD